MKIWNEALDEGLFHKKLDNNINLYFYPKIGFTKKYAIFSTNFGSNNINFVDESSGSSIQLPSGTAHFLEHKLFEDPDKNIFESFAQYGANVNAYTNFDQTSYLFSCTDNFYESLGMLIKFVQNPYLTEENVEKEKGIIEQEIQMYNDNPQWRVFFNCLKAMYFNHPVKDDIAGTIESVRKIRKSDLVQAYEKFYHPSNMVLFVVGDLDLYKIIESVNNSSGVFPELISEFSRETVIEPQGVREKYVEDRMSTARPLFYIGYKDLNLGLAGRENIKKDITTNIMLEMLFSESSEFYQELYKKGLIDSSFGAYFTGKKDYGHSLIVGQSDDPLMVKQLVAELSSRGSEVLRIESFERVRKKEMGRFLMGLNSVEFIANNLTDLYFQDFSLLDYLEVVNEISLEDVIKRFEDHFNDESCVMSVIWPEDMVK